MLLSLLALWYLAFLGFRWCLGLNGPKSGPKLLGRSVRRCTLREVPRDGRWCGGSSPAHRSPEQFGSPTHGCESRCTRLRAATVSENPAQPCDSEQNRRRRRRVHHRTEI
jgi:hypothetical protein